MFEQLIESEPVGAEFKNRRKFFMMSTVAVGILFLTAVVISIYAADFNLGAGQIDLQAMLGPVDMADIVPATPKPRPPTTNAPSKSDLPSRIDNIARTDEPTIVPNAISTERSNLVSRPNTDFRLGAANTDPVGSGRISDTAGPVGPSALGDTTPIAENRQVIDAPPVKKDPPPARPQPPVSLGVINGRAANLPKPNYPAAAIAVNAQGAVQIQVMIDESGRVISAHALGGHPLLRPAAEQAARNARFTPTLLSNVPVKVTGVIVYNFSR